MKINNLLYGVVLILAISCAEERHKNEVTRHPVQENMPHANVSSHKLEVHDAGEYVDMLPEKARALYRFLNHESQEVNRHELELLTTDDIDISAINDSTLLILERDNNRLIQYDVKDDEYSVIANEGRGPGDLLFSKELSVYNGRAFIAMQGFRISVFSCNEGLCEYDRTITTEYNNYSLAPADDVIYFLGVAPFGREQNPDPSNTNQYLVHQINYKGEKEKSWLPVYNFRAPLVREQMNSGGRVRSFPEFGATVVSFSFFPHIYLYDSAGELTAKYEVPDFIQAFYEYKEDEGGYSSRLIYGSNSNISFTSKLDDRWLLVRIREQRDVEYISLKEGFRGDEWHSYYAFDVAEKKLYKIGDDITTPVYESRVLHLTNQSVIINEAGTLFLADIEYQ